MLACVAVCTLEGFRFVPWIIFDVLRNSGDPQDKEHVLWTCAHI